MRASAPWRETQISTRTIYWVIGLFTIGYPAFMIMLGMWIQKVWGIF